MNFLIVDKRKLLVSIVIFLFLPIYGYAQSNLNAKEQDKIAFQGYVAGNIMQTAFNIEFIKSQCNSYIPSNAPLRNINYEDAGYLLVKKYITHSSVLFALKDMRSNAIKNASLEQLAIPGLKGGEWCIAALHTNISLFNSTSNILKKTNEL